MAIEVCRHPADPSLRILLTSGAPPPPTPRKYTPGRVGAWVVRPVCTPAWCRGLAWRVEGNARDQHTERRKNNTVIKPHGEEATSFAAMMVSRLTHLAGIAVRAFRQHSLVATIPSCAGEGNVDASVRPDRRVCVRPHRLVTFSITTSHMEPLRRH